MISRAQSDEIARRYIDELGSSVEGGVAIIPEATIEKPYGWVYFFNSKRYLAGGNVFDALGGNSPILVECSNGRVTLLGTALPVSVSLRRFEEENGLSSEKLEE